MKHFFLKLLTAAGLLALPALAMAGDSFIGGSGKIWELPAFGNTEVLHAVLLTIGRIVKNDTYRSIILTVATLGILAKAAQFVFDAGKALVSSVGYFISVVFLLFAFGIGASGSNRLQAHIAIVDMVSGSRVVVEEPVPGFIVWPQVFLYSVAHQLTLQLETNMGGPGYEGLSTGSPFNLAAQMIRDASKVKITDGNLRSTMAEYVANCVMPMLANGVIGSDVLSNSPDLLAALKVDNSILSTPIYEPNSTDGSNVRLAGCSDAHANITTRMGTYFNNAGLEKALGKAMGMSGTPLASPLLDIAQASLLYTTKNSATDVKSLVQQNAMAEIVGTGMAAGQASYNADQIMAQTQIELAHQSQLSAWDAGLAIFSKTMGYFFSMLQAFMLAALPVLIVFMFVPGLGKNLLINVGQVLLWMALWEPMLAVVSFVTSMYVAQDTQSAIADAVAPGFALANMGVITQQAQTMVSAAGFMAVSVPMLAWGLVKGSFAFTEFISHGVGTQFANTAGTGMASGNLSMGNKSMDTTSANQHTTGFGYHNDSTFSSNSTWGGAGNASVGMPQGTPGVTSRKGTSSGVSSEQKASAINSASSSLEAAKSRTDSESKAFTHALADRLTSSLANSQTATSLEKAGWSKDATTSALNTVTGAIADAKTSGVSGSTTNDWATQVGLGLDKLAQSMGGKSDGAGGMKFANAAEASKFSKMAGAIGNALGVGISRSSGSHDDSTVGLQIAHTTTKSGTTGNGSTWTDTRGHEVSNAGATALTHSGEGSTANSTELKRLQEQSNSLREAQNQEKRAEDALSKARNLSVSSDSGYDLASSYGAAKDTEDAANAQLNQTGATIQDQNKGVGAGAKQAQGINQTPLVTTADAPGSKGKVPTNVGGTNQFGKVNGELVAEDKKVTAVGDANKKDAAGTQNDATKAPAKMDVPESMKASATEALKQNATAMTLGTIGSAATAIASNPVAAQFFKEGVKQAAAIGGRSVVAAGAGATVAGVAGAAVVGYNFGTYVANPLINYGVQAATGEADATLGGKIYDWTHPETTVAEAYNPPMRRK